MQFDTGMGRSEAPVDGRVQLRSPSKAPMCRSRVWYMEASLWVLRLSRTKPYHVSVRIDFINQPFHLMDGL